MQAKAMRNYHLNYPFDDSRAALPWPTDPPETVRKLADLTRSHAKATMQTTAAPLLGDPGQQGTHPICKPHAPRAPPPPVPAKRARRKRGAPAPNQAGKAAASQPPAPPPGPPGKPGPSILVILPPNITTTPPGQASSLSSFPPPAPPPPEASPGFDKRREGPAALPQ